MRFIYAWFWPWLMGVLVFALVGNWSSHLPGGPFQFVWMLCVFATSWVAAQVTRAVLDQS